MSTRVRFPRVTADEAAACPQQRPFKRRLSAALIGGLLWVTGLAVPAFAAEQQHGHPPKATGAPVPLSSAQAPLAAFIPPNAPASFADLAERLLPAVVNISTTQSIPARPGADEPPGSPGKRPPRQAPEMPQFPPGSPFEEFFKDFFDRHGNESQGPRRATSLGSGFIVDAKEGYVVTNNHVIEGADEITIRLQDDTTIKADLVGRDPKIDIALLKVNTDHPLVAVPFGDSDKIRVGDWVVAIGNPFGFGGTVTSGIISARARDIGAGQYDDFLQTDAAINKGNSGGPMFNLNGEVIGINTAIYSPTGMSVGIGFSIPSALVKPVIEQLKQYGRTRRGWMGVRIQAVTPEIAESLGLGKVHGALIASTTPGGPAAAAGILPGDIVLSFDGKEIGEMRRLPRIVAETPIDKQAPVTLWRKGQQMSVQVKVGELEAAEESGLLSASVPDEPVPHAPAPQMVEALGLKLTSITNDLRDQFDLEDDVRGVLVTEVDGGSAAADKGVRPGDVIIEVSQEEVNAPEDVAAKIKKARDQGKKSILLLVDRKGDLRFVALALG
ncbi:MAG TPA: Do family serine endopeptidase [Azospirillaceae bacterium]|nr:Do family serine endopeptidase [Azospirillaceae bacterium]